MHNIQTIKQIIMSNDKNIFYQTLTCLYGLSKYIQLPCSIIARKEVKYRTFFFYQIW